MGEFQCPHHEKIEDKCGQVDKLIEAVNEKIGLRALIPIMAIVVTILGIFIGILHVEYRDTIQTLGFTDAVITKIMSEQNRMTNDTLKSIEVNIAIMKTDIEHIKKNGKIP